MPYTPESVSHFSPKAARRRCRHACQGPESQGRWRWPAGRGMASPWGSGACDSREDASQRADARGAGRQRRRCSPSRASGEWGRRGEGSAAPAPGGGSEAGARAQPLRGAPRAGRVPPSGLGAKGPGAAGHGERPGRGCGDVPPSQQPSPTFPSAGPGPLRLLAPPPSPSQPAPLSPFSPSLPPSSSRPWLWASPTS